jgi:predicted nucleic acid-binding Zn ribbon protein
MKFCPFCGAAIESGAAAFCSECGQQLTVTEKPAEPVRKPNAQSAPKRKPSAINKKPPHLFKFHIRSKPPKPVRKPKPDPREDGYDGYYNDVKPADNGRIRERTDPELIKRIAFIAIGALVLVIFSLIIMYLL